MNLQTQKSGNKHKSRSNKSYIFKEMGHIGHFCHWVGIFPIRVNQKETGAKNIIISIRETIGYQPEIIPAPPNKIIIPEK